MVANHHSCRNAPVCDAVCRLRAVEAGERGRLSGEASVRPGEAELQKLLVLGPAGDPEGLQGNAVHQRSQVDPRTHESSHGSRRILIRTAPVLRLVSSLSLFAARWPASHRVTSSARCSRSTWWSTGRVNTLSVWRPNWSRSTWRAPSTRNHQSQVSLEILNTNFCWFVRLIAKTNISNGLIYTVKNWCQFFSIIMVVLCQTAENSKSSFCLPFYTVHPPLALNVPVQLLSSYHVITHVDLKNLSMDQDRVL